MTPSTTPNEQQDSAPARVQSSTATLDPATHVGTVEVSVADLNRSIPYYTDAIGLALLQQGEGQMTLGAGGKPLLKLVEQPGALPWMTDQMTGLYHFAILVPTRADLGRWLRHYLTTSFPPPGQGDHIVSEALYLRDPDGHGIEIYADRPREGWQWENGRVRMGGGPVDIRGILAEGDATNVPWAGLAPGTHLGHMHLQVGDIAQAEAFYSGILGFDVTASMPTALFVSAGGYHHHLGMNTWHSAGASPATPDTAQLRAFSVELPSEAARSAMVGRIAAAGVPTSQQGEDIAVEDPWHNVVLLRVDEVAQ